MFNWLFSPDSLANVESQWAKEVKHFCKGVPVILVGNKIDLRGDQEMVANLAKKDQVSISIHVLSPDELEIQNIICDDWYTLHF